MQDKEFVEEDIGQLQKDVRDCFQSIGKSLKSFEEEVTLSS